MKNIILPHEHLYIDLSTVKNDPDTKMDNIQQVIDELKELKKFGVSTIVEATNIGMGRNVKILEHIQNETGLKILVSTGFYQQAFYFNLVEEKTIDDLYNVMEKDILFSIDGSNLSATVIGEIGTSLNKITKQEEKVLTASCRLSLKYDLVILTHLSLGTMAKEQLSIMIRENVKLSKIIFSHIELSNDLEYILEILKSGVNIGIDTCGKLSYLSDERRIEIIKKIIENGYINQLVLSMDISRKSYMKSNGGFGWTYLFDSFITKMKKANITEKEIEIIFSNPNRIYDIN